MLVYVLLEEADVSAAVIAILIAKAMELPSLSVEIMLVISLIVNGYIIHIYITRTI